MLRHRKNWTDKHTRLVRIVTVFGLIGVAALGTYSIHSGKAAGPVTSAAPGADSNACAFLSVPNPSIAFCESFSTVTPFDARYSRSGDLNGQIWGVSRLSSVYNPGQNQFSMWGDSHIDGCGSTATVSAPNDVRVCNGRVYEANNDEHTQTTVAMYPKQPFNFAGRTGTVVFDSSTDTHGGHGHWPEFWITDNPIPAPHGDNVSGQGHFIRNGVGFTLRVDKCGGDPGKVSIDEIDVIRNYSERETWNWLNNDPAHALHPQCITKSKGGDANINHFEIKVSHDTMQVYGTNPGSTQLILLAQANNLNLSFTQGLVWMNDVAYNATKDEYPSCCGEANQVIHTFAWDNLGFDGPKTYRDLAYDVPDNHIPGSGDNGPGFNHGYALSTNTPISFTLPNVTWNQQPTGAIATFDWADSPNHIVPQVSVNDGPYHSWCEPNCSTLPAWPFNSGTNDPDFYRAIAVPIPLSEIHQGSNKLTFKYAGTTTISLVNINLIMVAGDPVPTANITPGDGTGTSPTPPPPTPTPPPTPPPTSPPLSCTTIGTNSFYGCYYDNMDFTNLLVTRNDGPTLNFNWPAGTSPDPLIGEDQFSVKWEGDFSFASASTYRFSATTDDGMRVYVDGAILIDQWHDQSPTTYTADKSLTAGTHRVKVEYYENAVGAVAAVSWSPVGTTPPTDTTPPTVNFTFPGMGVAPTDGGTVTDQRQLTVNIASSDASGIASTTATINGSPVTITGNNVITPNANGNYTISVVVKDNANNTTTKTFTTHLRHRDINRSGTVDLLDLSQLLKAWNTASDLYDFNDVNGSRLVNLYDISYLMQGWGLTQ